MVTIAQVVTIRWNALTRFIAPVTIARHATSRNATRSG